MTIRVDSISGFPEWLPNLRLAEERFIDTIREQYQLFGFTPIETPAVERLEVLLAKGGLGRQVFSLGRPQEGAGEAELGLHFDLTVPLARYVSAHQQELTFPFRRYQIQKVWRGERAQRGRFRGSVVVSLPLTQALSVSHPGNRVGSPVAPSRQFGRGRGWFHAICPRGDR